MASLTEIVKQEIAWYAAGGLDAKSYLLANEVEQVYAVNVVSRTTPKPQWPADVVVIARIAGELVIIEEDRTDKPLVDRLVAASIPRDKIILAYAGEPLPDMS